MKETLYRNWKKKKISAESHEFNNINNKKKIEKIMNQIS